MKRFFFFLPLFFLLGCTAQEIASVVNIAQSKDPVAAARTLGAQKMASYARNPESFKRDASLFTTALKKFNINIDLKWGEKNSRKPTTKKYVKYTQNYQSRAEVDFNRGIITVETLDREKSYASLKDAIITTLMTPEDPRGVDLYSSEPIKLSGTPYLQGEVLDNNSREISTYWQAENFATYLVKHKVQEKNISIKGVNKRIKFVAIPMVKDHNQIRAKKYGQYVEEYANRYKISKNLVYAVMKVESNFNPYAVSHVPAFGLMQIVPQSAGRDAYRKIYNKDRVPTKEYLFQANKNIEMGTAYLNILNYSYLKDVRNPLSREYCVIAAYNTGAGNVLRTFSKDKTEAVRQINAMKPGVLYQALRNKLKHAEARRYLYKVVMAKKEFVGI